MASKRKASSSWDIDSDQEVQEWDVEEQEVVEWDVDDDGGDDDPEPDEPKEKKPEECSPQEAIYEFIACLVEMFLSNQIRANQFAILAWWAAQFCAKGHKSHPRNVVHFHPTACFLIFICWNIHTTAFWSKAQEKQNMF